MKRHILMTELMYFKSNGETDMATTEKLLQWDENAHTGRSLCHLKAQRHIWRNLLLAVINSIKKMYWFFKTYVLSINTLYINKVLAKRDQRCWLWLKSVVQSHWLILMPNLYLWTLDQTHRKVLNKHATTT